jgi:hypothetical protein
LHTPIACLLHLEQARLEHLAAVLLPAERGVAVLPRDTALPLVLLALALQELVVVERVVVLRHYRGGRVITEPSLNDLGRSEERPRSVMIDATQLRRPTVLVPVSLAPDRAVSTRGTL